MDIINELKEYNIEPIVVDPIADKEEAKHEYNLDLTEMKKLYDLDVLLVAVSHQEFKSLNPQIMRTMFSGLPILFDLKGIFDKNLFESEGFAYWRL
jgi:UDP-N-acetyl-D-galactosamine dehydrogenase